MPGVAGAGFSTALLSQEYLDLQGISKQQEGLGFTEMQETIKQ